MALHKVTGHCGSYKVYACGGCAEEFRVLRRAGVYWIVCPDCGQVDRVRDGVPIKTDLGNNPGLIFKDSEFDLLITMHSQLHGDGQKERLRNQLIEEGAELTSALAKMQRTDRGDEAEQRKRVLGEVGDTVVSLEAFLRAYKVTEAELELAINDTMARWGKGMTRQLNEQDDELQGLQTDLKEQLLLMEECKENPGCAQYRYAQRRADRFHKAIYDLRKKRDSTPVPLDDFRTWLATSNCSLSEDRTVLLPSGEALLVVPTGEDFASGNRVPLVVEECTEESLVALKRIVAGRLSVLDYCATKKDSV